MDTGKDRVILTHRLPMSYTRRCSAELKEVFQVGFGLLFHLQMVSSSMTTFTSIQMSVLMDGSWLGGFMRVPKGQREACKGLGGGEGEGEEG